MMKNRFSAEQQLVVQTFGESFASKKNQNIILYGVGINTKAVLEGTQGFCFVGLMDAASEGQVVYHLPVYSADQVSQMRPKPVIVIIARQAVVNIIYKRIAWLYEKEKIDIFDFQGKHLGVDAFDYKNQDLPYWNSDEEQLKAQIDIHDIITFDIFDTLLMRRVLNPTDVFELVERKLYEQGIKISFKKLRVIAEKKLDKAKKYPDIDEIYEELNRILRADGVTHLLSDDLDKIKQMEIDTDKQLLLKREKMVELFDYALQTGKKVYLLSDMYYPADFLMDLLDSFGISGYEDIWVSCEKKCTKSDGSMYFCFTKYLIQTGLLKDNLPESTHHILHIGDNRYADYENAAQAGYDAFLIYSALELLQASSLQEILADVNTLEKRVMLGILLTRMANDPFTFHKNKGWFYIEDEWEIGYYFIAPIILEFTKWLVATAENEEISKILFPSRDGYLIQKVYHCLAGQGAIPDVYFRASRRALTVAAIKDRHDIQVIAKRSYQGTCGTFFLSRFGVTMDDSDARINIKVQKLSDEELNRLLNDYEEKILLHAAFERKCYLSYLKKMGICASEDKMLIFDFVAGGTVQNALERLLNMKLQGAYFATMNLPNSLYAKDTDAIQTAYGNIESYKIDTNLGKYYLLMETILVDEKQTLSYIDEYLNPVYEKTCERTNVGSIRKLQKGVLQYVKDYTTCFTNLKIDLTFADEIYGLLFSKRCIVSESLKQIFENDDYYDGQEIHKVFGK